MVTFTCTGCGGTLKKKQVETHRTRCRKSDTVSCIDCLKDFFGQEYDSHTKCISEAERYGAADTEVPVEKGALKQQQWMKTAHEAIENVNEVTPYERTLLQGLTKYDNLPRKKLKFVNFMKNSVKIRNEDLIEKIWSIFETAMNSSNGPEKTGEGKPGKENDCPKAGDSHKPKKEKQRNGVPEVGNEEKLSKKEKKRRNSAKCDVESSETPDETENNKKKRQSENNVTEDEVARLKKKDKKNKQSDIDRTTGEEEQEDHSEKPKKDKKKKKRDSELPSVETDDGNAANSELQTPQAGGDVGKPDKKKKKKGKGMESNNNCDVESARENPSSKKKRNYEDDDGIETTAQENGLTQDLVNGDKILSKKEKRKKKKEEQKLANENADEVVMNDVDVSLNGSMEVDEQCTVDVPKNLSKKERKKLAKRLAQEQEDAKRQTENAGEEDEEEANQKLGKKEKKRRQREDIRREQNGVKKASSSDKVEEEPVGGKKKGKKNKKRMLSGSESAVNPEEIGVKNSKKQKAELANGHEGSLEINRDVASDEEEESPAMPRKFRWDKAIKTALKECSESEMAVKKLKKKVLAHYIEMGGEGKGEVSLDDLSATFNHKLSHNPKFKVFKDKVSLTSK